MGRLAKILATLMMVLGLAAQLAPRPTRTQIMAPAPAPSAPTATAVPAPKHTEVRPVAPSEDIQAFRQLAGDTLGRLPTVEAFRANPKRETHFTPAELLDSAPLLAKLTLALKANPRLIPEGIAFYDECARREGLMTATRAVCLRDLRYWTTQSGAPTVDAGQFPARIWDIASYLPPTP